MDIIVACNTGLPYVKPSWWDDPLPDRMVIKRKFPYNKFPLNKTPMTHWPKRFRWRARNVKYHVYSASGVSCVSCLCCILLLLIMGMSKKGRRR